MKYSTRSLILYFLISLYTLLFVAFYFFISRVSHLQIYIIPDWQRFLLETQGVRVDKLLFDTLASLGGIVLVVVAWVALGLFVLTRLKIYTKNKLAQVASAFTVGQIFYSILWLSFISLFGLPKSLTILSLLLGLAIGFKELIALAKGCDKGCFIQKEEWLLIGLAALVMTLSLFSSASRLGYDAVVEYFSHAKLMAVTGSKGFFYPSDGFVVSSFHPGILFTGVIQVFGDQAARLLSWVNGLAIIILGLALAWEFGLSRLSALYFTVLLLTSTAFLDLLGDGKVELINTTQILAAVYWLICSKQLPSKTVFLLIGFLSGFAFISRPYNLFLVGLFLVIYYLQSAYGTIYIQGWNYYIRTLQPTFWVLPGVILLGAFHLWQNWLWLGSPFAPLDYAQGLDSSDWQWQLDATRLNTMRLLYPFTITFFNTSQSLGNISPLFISFLCFLAFERVRSQLQISAIFHSVLLSAIPVLSLWVMLFFTVVEIRYVFFLWIFLFLLTARIIEIALASIPNAYRTFFKLIMASLLVFCGWRGLSISLATNSPIDSGGQAHCYTSHYCTLFEQVNQQANPGDRVFVLNAYRYYLRNDLFICSSRSEEYALLQSLAQEDATGFWRELYRQGFVFLTYEGNYSIIHSHFGELPPLESAPAWLHIDPVYISPYGNEAAYRLTAAEPPFPPQKKCLLAANGLWQIRYGR